jgi:uncharacterized SAM-binding protein YcdF (DUF218 family)
MNLPRLPQKWLFVLSLPVGIWLLGLYAFLLQLPTQVDDLITHTQAIVVLTGGSDRINTGIGLLHLGLADRLFVTGVHKGVETADIVHASHMDIAKALVGQIELGHNAEDTLGNAQETAAWAKANSIHSIRLVTASYHMQRSLWEFKQYMPEVVIISNPVFPDVKIGSFGYMALIASEYSKYILARAKFIVKIGA